LFLGFDGNFGEWSFRILFWVPVEVTVRKVDVVVFIFLGVVVAE
jgi:hypothetical protein